MQPDLFTPQLGAPPAVPTSQKECVLIHLLERPLSMPDAVKQYNIYRLAAIIHMLKKEGYNIVTNDVKFTNRYGHESSYAVYQLLNPTTHETTNPNSGAHTQT